MAESKWSSPLAKMNYIVTAGDATASLSEGVSIGASVDAPAGGNKTAIRTGRQWVLKNAWVVRYFAPDLDASGREAAIESVEIAYEKLEIQ